MSEQNTPDHKFRTNLGKNLLGLFFGFLLIVALIGVGIWDVVDPFILQNGNSIIGIIAILLGAILLIIWPRNILKWDMEMTFDFVVFIFTVILMLGIVGINLFLPEIVSLILIREWAPWLILMGGIFLVVISILLAPHRNKKGNYRWSLGASFMVLGSELVVYGVYLITGRYLIL